MAFKVGEKVVCIKHDPINKQDGKSYPAPKQNEIVTIEYFEKSGFLGLLEYQEEFMTPWNTLERIVYDPHTFRKLDYDFVEDVISNLKEQPVEA